MLINLDHSLWESSVLITSEVYNLTVAERHTKSQLSVTLCVQFPIRGLTEQGVKEGSRAKKGERKGGNKTLVHWNYLRKKCNFRSVPMTICNYVWTAEVAKQLSQ